MCIDGIRHRGCEPRMIGDFVPNHVMTDQPWVTDHPDYIIGGKAASRRAPRAGGNSGIRRKRTTTGRPRLRCAGSNFTG